MAYILSAQRDPGPPASVDSWNRYQAYLRENEARFPPGAYALATSDWYFGFSDHRAPHDAWLESATFSEPSQGERNENRTLSLRLRLLGAYHDHWLEFFYPQVYSYTLSNSAAAGGHGDWRYDEFRLSSSGNLLHEIEWAGPPGVEARWVIEATDVIFGSVPRSEA
jgi:hypothetical protein